MPEVLAVSGSPSASSRTAAAAQYALNLLKVRGFTVSHIAVRDLPAASLLAARAGSPDIHHTLTKIDGADGIIVATPIYKASYTGLLKLLLDLLPQDGLSGKTVLPLATGGTIAHLLALDYALRPVLAALNAGHVTAGTFLLDSTFSLDDSGISPTLKPDARVRVREAVARFTIALPQPGKASYPSALSGDQLTDVARV